MSRSRWFALLVGGLRVAGGLLPSVLCCGCLYAIVFAPAQEMAVFCNSYQSAGAREDLRSARGAAECAGSHAPDRPLAGEGRALGFGVSSSPTADRVILPTFDLDIPAGQTIALVGSTRVQASRPWRSSSRGSTIPSDGIVSLDGIDLRRLHPKDLRRAIVMVTQEAYLFSGSVADNIALGKPVLRRRRFARCRTGAVGAHEFIQSLPNGYDTTT
jgi:ATP-binding cassette subfamily B protein